MFLQVSVCPRGGGVRGCSRGGVRGCSGGACLVAPGGACLVAPRGVCGCSWGGMHGCSGGGVRGIRRDTEIRSMSGRYASYWNAFLFLMSCCLLADDGIEDEFLCPITREVMREPVIASGIVNNQYYKSLPPPLKRERRDHRRDFKYVALFSYTYHVCLSQLGEKTYDAPSPCCFINDAAVTSCQYWYRS